MGGKRTRVSKSQNPRPSNRRRTDDHEEQQPPRQGEPRGSNQPRHTQAPSSPNFDQYMDRDAFQKHARENQARRNREREAAQEDERDALAGSTAVQRGRPSGGNSAADEDDEGNASEGTIILACGKKFVATRMLWLPSGVEDDVFDASIDDRYDPLERFGSEPQNAIQGALRDVLEVLPDAYSNGEKFLGGS